MSKAPPRSKVGWLRLFGPLLLVVLLLRLDFEQLYVTLSRANLAWVLASFALIVPLIALKTVRWQGILRAQAIEYPFGPALVAYFASMFIGFLTPGRVGEFTKALYVWHDCQSSERPVSFGWAFSGVIADRLFDLGVVMVVSILAVAGLYISRVEWAILVGSVVFAGIALGLFLADYSYAWMLRVVTGFGRKRFVEKIFALKGVQTAGKTLTETRLGLRQLQGMHLLAAVSLTVLAYLLYFLQCYWLALALNLPLSYALVSYAVALGGLVTLLPLSISGLGTREAVITLYLGQWGVPAEAALGFSLLVFAVFYLGGSLIGALAWWRRPTPYSLAEAVSSAQEKNL